MNKGKWIELKINDFVLWSFRIEKEENLKALESFMRKLYQYDSNNLKMEMEEQ